MSQQNFNARFSWVDAYEALAQALKTQYEKELTANQKIKGDYSSIVEKVKTAFTNAFTNAEIKYYYDEKKLRDRATALVDEDCGFDKTKMTPEQTKVRKKKVDEKVADLKQNPTILKEVGDATRTDIDPFSIFGFLNREAKQDDRRKLASAMMKAFMPDNNFSFESEQFHGIPTSDARNTVFNQSMDNAENNKKLWKLFIKILDWNPKQSSNEDCEKLAAEIREVEKINGFTDSRIYLYWVQPHKFLPLDGKSTSYLNFMRFKGLEKTELKNLKDAFKYLKKCADFSKQDASQRPFATFLEFSDDANRFATSANGKAMWLLKTNYNLVLHGAPGTGKTYMAKRIAESMGAEIELVQFHPSYDYSDFVEGLRPVHAAGESVGFRLKEGTFKAFCRKALEACNKKDVPSKKFVFIIDEINRGDISKIFGELFFSVDPGYRGIRGAVLTQYSNMVEKPNEFDEYVKFMAKKNLNESTDAEMEEEVEVAKKLCEETSGIQSGHFFVPENVYIIGTMNDIDRGVESMDFAFRRRFAWLEVSSGDRVEILDDKLGDKAALAKTRMTELNEAIDKNPNLGKAYQIGPAYFLKLKDFLDEEKPWDCLWKYHLEGLLRDYLRGTESDAKKEEIELEKLRIAYYGQAESADGSTSDVDDKPE